MHLQTKASGYAALKMCKLRKVRNACGLAVSPNVLTQAADALVEDATVDPFHRR